MKISKLITIFFLLIFVNSYSQEIQKAKNTVYLDVGLILSGNSVFMGLGLNYERMLNDNYSIRAGANIGFFGTHVIGDKISGTCIGFPITFNYLTKNKNKFEAGLGGGPWINLDQENSLSFFPAVKLGYRYQPDEGGLMLKAGLELPANTYISLGGVGYSFK
jgi:hypothetical protein